MTLTAPTGSTASPPGRSPLPGWPPRSRPPCAWTRRSFATSCCRRRRPEGSGPHSRPGPAGGEPGADHRLRRAARRSDLTREALADFMRLGRWGAPFQVGIESFGRRMLGENEQGGRPADQRGGGEGRERNWGRRCSSISSPPSPRMTRADLEENLEVLESIRHLLVRPTIHLYPSEFYLPAGLRYPRAGRSLPHPPHPRVDFLGRLPGKRTARPGELSALPGLREPRRTDALFDDPARVARTAGGARPRGLPAHLARRRRPAHGRPPGRRGRTAPSSWRIHGGCWSWRRWRRCRRWKRAPRRSRGSILTRRDGTSPGWPAKGSS